MRTLDEAYEELLSLERDSARVEEEQNRIREEAEKIEKRVGGEAFEKLQQIQRKLTVIEALGYAQRLEREVKGLCPVHEDSRLNLWEAKLSCGHSVGEVAELLQELAERLERKLREGREE